MFLVAWAIYALATPDAIYLPSVENIGLLFIVLVLSSLVRNSYARYTFLVWGIWFILGSISLFAQNHLNRGLNYNVDPSLGNRLYLLCTIASILGALAVQAATSSLRDRQRPVTPTRGANQIVWIALLAFPVLYSQDATSVQPCTRSTMDPFTTSAYSTSLRSSCSG
jgi:hypothetical protein